MTCSNPPLPSLILSNCAMKWKNVTGSPFEFLFQDWGYRESFLQEPQAHLFVVTILFVALLWSELSSVLSPKFVTRSPTTYKNGLGHGKKTGYTNGNLKYRLGVLARWKIQCLNVGGLSTSKATWHYERNLTLRRWIAVFASQELKLTSIITYVNHGLLFEDSDLLRFYASSSKDILILSKQWFDKMEPNLSISQVLQTPRSRKVSKHVLHEWL